MVRLQRLCAWVVQRNMSTGKGVDRRMRLYLMKCAPISVQSLEAELLLCWVSRCFGCAKNQR